MYIILILFSMALAVAGCTSSDTPSDTLEIPSPTLTQTAAAPPTQIPESTETAPAPLSTLTICMIAEPVSLYYYTGEDVWTYDTFEAIYDGPIDHLSYGYQPVILEKLPSLADGDATLQPVTVREGDRIVNDNGEVVQLAVGELIRPFGCNQHECAVVWDGSPITMTQLSATFMLMEGIKWSDGEPLTSADSVFSFNVARNCGYPWGEEYGPCGMLGAGGLETLERTASYTALDELTTQWVGLPGYLDAYYQTNYAHPLPAHVLANYPPDSLYWQPEATTNPLGWGAYVIQKWEPGQYINMIRNPNYFRANEGLPIFDELTFLFFTEDPQAGIDLLLSGTCDIVEPGFFRSGGIDELFDMDARGEIKMIVEVRNVWDHADFNMHPNDVIRNTGAFAGWDLDGDGVGPFGDVRLRQAITMCMDRQAVVDELFYGRSQWFDTFLPPSHPLYLPPVTGYSYNVAAAAALLDEIGWLDVDHDPQTPRTAQGVTGVPDGTLLAFNYETNTDAQRQQAAQIQVESMSLCGISVDLIYHPSNEWFAAGPDGRLFGRRFDIGQYAAMASDASDCQRWQSEYIPGDPLIFDDSGNPVFPHGWTTLSYDLPVNPTGYENEAFNIACNLAMSSLPGQPEYVDYASQVQSIFANDLPVIPLYLHVNVAATSRDVCGFDLDPSALSDLWNIETFTVEPGCK